MKRHGLFGPILLAVLFTFGLGVLGFRALSQSSVPPLSLEGYMDEHLPDALEEDNEQLVDNSSCFVCHDDFRDDELTIEHGKEEVGCIKCHGESFDHRDDEDHITPPDKMFEGSTVDQLCAACHIGHVAEPKKVVERWQERCSEIEDPDNLSCTDCHFSHGMKRRSVRWDRKTGEVIPRSVWETPTEPEENPDPIPASLGGGMQ